MHLKFPVERTQQKTGTDASKDPYHHTGSSAGGDEVSLSHAYLVERGSNIDVLNKHNGYEIGGLPTSQPYGGADICGYKLDS